MLPTPIGLADWSTSQPFVLPELGPGVEGELRAQLEAALHRISTCRWTLIVSGCADAERLAGSRWHGTSEAARQGRVLVVRLS